MNFKINLLHRVVCLLSSTLTRSPAAAEAATHAAEATTHAAEAATHAAAKVDTRAAEAAIAAKVAAHASSHAAHAVVHVTKSGFHATKTGTGHISTEVVSKAGRREALVASRAPRAFAFGPCALAAF